MVAYIFNIFFESDDNFKKQTINYQLAFKNDCKIN
jgi:hypothetical protein